MFYIRGKQRITTWNSLYEIPVPLSQDLPLAQASCGKSFGRGGSSWKTLLGVLSCHYCPFLGLSPENTFLLIYMLLFFYRGKIYNQ